MRQVINRQAIFKVWVLAVVWLAGCASPVSPRLYDEEFSARREVLRRAVVQPLSQLRSIESVNLFQDNEELELDELVKAVLERNPALVAMQSAWRAAASRYPQVTSLDDPMFSYGLAPASIDSGNVDFGQKIGLSQRFPWPGKLALRGEIALSESDAARSEFDVAKEQLIQQTKRVFFEYYFVFRAIEINNVNQSLLDEFRRIADTKYAAGTASKQDALQAEVEHNHLLHRGIVLERSRRVTRSRINTLLHRSPELELPPPPAELSIPEMDFSAEELQRQAVNHRPELEALAHRVRSGQTARRLARNEYYPDFTVMGTYNSLSQEDDLQPFVGVSINVPLGLERRRAVESEALSELTRLQAEFASAVSDVAMQVTEALERLTESEHVLSLYQTKLLPAAKDNLDAARSGYESGKNDFLTLVTAEKALMLMELEYQRSLAEYHQRLADLERAVGRGGFESNGPSEEVSP